MDNIIIFTADAQKTQDLAGLRAYLKPHIEAKTVVLEEKSDHIEVTCPTNYTVAFRLLMPRYGYWVSEIQEHA